MVKRGKKKEEGFKEFVRIFFFFSSTIRNNLIKSEEVRKGTRKKNIIYELNRLSERKFHGGEPCV